MIDYSAKPLYNHLIEKSIPARKRGAQSRWPTEKRHLYGSRVTRHLYV